MFGRDIRCASAQFGRVSRRPRAPLTTDSPPRPSGLGGPEPGTSKLPQGGVRLCGPQSKPPIRRPWGIAAGATGALRSAEPSAGRTALAWACTARAWFRVATVAVVGRLRPAPATSRADPPAGAGGTYRAGPVQNRIGGGYCSGLLRGDGNCSCSRHGRAESSPWSTQSSVLQGDSVCAIGRVGCALAPGAVSLVGGVRGRVDCQVCCTSGRSSLWPFRR